MKLKDFSFNLPKDRIARFPSNKREESKLMMVERKTGKITHHVFNDIVDLISCDDFLVLNNSKVIPVKLFGKINGKIVEVLIVKRKNKNLVEVFALPAKRFKKGETVLFNNFLKAEVIEIGDRGKRILKFNRDFDSVLKLGYAPLPPYIKRKFEEAEKFREYDLDRYQTIYSKNGASIAAPTAGLHFSQELLDKIKEKSDVLEITLNVGMATFQKIDVENISDHKMGREYITIEHETVERIKSLKHTKNLIAIGTTTVRSLETYAIENPKEEDFYSEIFISPGFEFKMADKLVTNFHLPESSLFILTSAFAGLELMKEAYRIAIENEYRFFSYGDVMFIV